MGKAREAADQNDVRGDYAYPHRWIGGRECLNKTDGRWRCAGQPKEKASSCRWVADRRASRAKHPEPRLADIGRSVRRGRTLGSTTHRTPTMKQKPSTSLKVPTPSTPTPLRQRESDQAPSSSFRQALYTGSEPVQKAGDYFASGLRASKPRSSVGLHTEQPTSSHAGRQLLLVAPTPYAGAPRWQSLGDLRLRVVSLSRCRTRRSLGTVPPHTPNSSRDVRPARGTQRWTGQVRQRARPASMPEASCGMQKYR